MLYRLRKFLCSTLLLLVLTSACMPRNVPRMVTPRPSRTPAPTGTPRLTSTPAPTQTPRPTDTPSATPTPVELTFPIRAAFYDPGYAQSWEQNGQNPFSRYNPALGFYNLDDPVVISSHISAMQYGKIQVGIATWPGPGQGSDARVPGLLDAGARSGFFWALQPLSERLGDPDVSVIRADLAYIRVHYSGSPAYLHLNGRFVVFVEIGPQDGCDMVQRWQQASSMGAYVVMQTFTGYEGCAAQPNAWYPALPADAESAQTAYAFVIRPGFWQANEGQPRLGRDLMRWAAAVRSMVSSGSPFQLVATFNNWGEGSAVEDAKEWAGSPGHGQYLDALHVDGDLALMFPYRESVPFVNIADAAILLGAGDIAMCDKLEGAKQTTALLTNQLERYPNAQLFTAGDNTQIYGKPEEFKECFDPTWGRFKNRIHPAPGNHDATDNLGPYFDYFGAAAGERGQGYYSYDLGGWHIISLNSMCETNGGCVEGTAQEKWLRADLASHRSRCTLAYWHFPMFKSGDHGTFTELIDLWHDLYNAGAEVIINGHEHMYERFARQDPAGNPDPQRGIREFIVGTGGAGYFHILGSPAPNSEVIIQDTLGVLKLELSPDRYKWEFIPMDEGDATDSGEEMCH